MVAAQMLVTEPPSPGTLAWRALLSQRKGRRGGPLPRHTLVRQEVPLEAKHAARYVAVCGSPPAHGVPMTYPHLLGFLLQFMLMTESAFSCLMIGLVHLCNTIRQHRRLQAGGRMCVEVRPRRLFHHACGQAFAVETAIIKTGTVVWESLSTYLRVGVPSPQGAPLIALPSVQDLSLDDRWDVPANTGRHHAGVLGDWNPIHVPNTGTKLLGSAHPIAHGMWTRARVLAALLPAAPLTEGGVVVEFKTPLSLLGVATLWQANETILSRAFEVRNTTGGKSCLRGILMLPHAQQDNTGDWIHACQHTVAPRRHPWR